MNIALIANDRKKQLMIDFCLLHAGTLCRHNLYATGTTGKLVEDVTGRKNGMISFSACATRTACPMRQTSPPPSWLCAR